MTKLEYWENYQNVTQRKEGSKCCRKNCADRLVQFRITTNFQFVKVKISVRHNKMRCNKTRYACITSHNLIFLRYTIVELLACSLHNFQKKLLMFAAIKEVFKMFPVEEINLLIKLILIFKVSSRVLKRFTLHRNNFSKDDCQNTILI